jgi:hypothetical protein
MDNLAWYLVLIISVLSSVAAIVTTVVLWVKRRRFPLLYSLLSIIASLYLLVFFVVLVFVLVSSLSHESIEGIGTGPMQQVEETEIPDLVIRTSVYYALVKDHSVQVNVFIFQRGQSLAGSNNALQPTVDLTPVGTPRVPIVKAFGPGYDVSAVSQLNASAFDVAPQGQQEQSLNQPHSVNFTWNVTPKFVGQQSLEVVVTGKWTRGGGTPIERPLASQFLLVNVVDTPHEDTPHPVISWGQLDASQLFVVFLSSVFNVPWIVELVKRWRASKQKEQKKATQTSHLGASPSSTKKRRRKR